MLTAHARPKVNLFLHVTGRRDDGYHLLESLVIFPDGGDVLTVADSDTLTFSASGPFSEKLGPEEDNLVLKAAKLLRSLSLDLPGAHISLIKNLPVASGIGGGSADAAAALMLLNRLWKLKKTPEDLAETGLELGADVPVCLHGQPAIMRGVGEKLTPVTVPPDFHLILVNPGYPVSTPAVFKHLSPPFTPEDPLQSVPDDLPGLVDWLGSKKNDLQAAAIEIVPAIKSVLEVLSSQSGCLLGRMSGSGATCFGIFMSSEEADMAAKNVKARHPDWKVSVHSHLGRPHFE